MTEESILHQQDLVEQRKLLITRCIAATVEVSDIRKSCLENLARWRAQGKSNQIWDEWETLLLEGAESEILYAMTSDDERCKNLRRAGPYTGLMKPVIREYLFSRSLMHLPTLEDLINFRPS